MADGRRKLSLMVPLRKASIHDGRGADAAVADLDEEMEKVFAMADEDRFDVARLAASPDSSSTAASKRSYGEKDYALHRKKSYQHMHPPLKHLHSHSLRRKMSSPEGAEGINIPGAGGEGREMRKASRAGTDSDTAQSPSTRSPTAAEELPRLILSGSASPEEERDETILSSESEPQVSERAASFGDSPIFGSPTDALRRVQFQIGEIAEKPEEGSLEDADQQTKELLQPEEPSKEVDKKPKRRHSRHHYHHHRSRKHSLQEDPQSRLRSGAEFSGVEGRRVSIQPEEAINLQEQDIDDLASHRFDDARGLRRYKLQKTPSSGLVHIGRKDGSEQLQSVLPLQAYKKMFDHSPHEVFVQLDELYGEGEDREWKETARWIKYEEDVEEGADRWGRPHVASLSFHSLLNLRRCLETGVVLLDLEERDLPGVAYRVVEQMVIDELIEAEDKPTVMRALLLRHRHVNDHDKFRFGMKRTFSSYTSLQNLNEEKGKPKIVPSIVSMDTMSLNKLGNNLSVPGEENRKQDNHTIDFKEELTFTSSAEDLKKAQKESILRRIPIGAEATTVLVGAVDFLDQPTIAFVRLAEGILMPSITEVNIPVRFLFILLGPSTADLDYHEIGRSISTLMSNAQFHKIAYKATERKELLSAINEFLDDSIVLPPGDWERNALLEVAELRAKSEKIRRRKTTRLLGQDEAKKVLLEVEGDGGKPPYDDPLQRTRKPFGGMINDCKRRFPHYVSDIIDGLNLTCLAAAIFIYFAALSAAITFGGLIADKTNNLIGISETLIATSAAGIFFALLSGQPLIIVGTTGPLLLFDESLYSFCETNGLEFLTVRVYIGFWLTVIALVVVAFEGSVMVKLFTRFTEEIFAALISALYIVESVMKLIKVFQKHPLTADYCAEQDEFSLFAASWYENSSSSNNSTNTTTVSEPSYVENTTNLGSLAANGNSSVLAFVGTEDKVDQPNTALLCLILSLGTFFIAYYLRQFRNSKFLGRSARRALGDFGVPIAIISMVILDYFVPATYTEKLKVPEGLSPSNPDVRGWIISPANLVYVWVGFAACAPALLVYILLFMETHITELIIDKKDRKLKKGSGFHLDILLVCLSNTFCGLIGAPWMCAATVRSLTHVSAVTIMSRTHAPGEKPHIIEVKEQRLSALLVAVMVGMSVLMAPLLRLVPMSVLFGVFLYMGISSTSGIQFFERLKLFFMPVKHHPQVAYVRRVRTMKMHLFTIIQLLCLAVLWIVKSTEASLAFPFFLILMVPLRAQLRFLFSPAELRALDSKEADGDKEDELDFYTEAPLPG
ncbi:band 3 anion transport protein [Schistocerca americana]|uniref:band 3 anion transport protein n=1 Tax=Schistocerca americana TaxID=7009 RepID=UPI001F500429|nr:band 3 anion transport protein [Schistocerca americana]XP_046996665.1 band 3 anion transport protein [Schistocerca americana]XP_049960265.1 band 3 anion transport protein isoform X1 [Schistocerca serialis cubense]XP_049960266.1 band 3 anion transport protein isoform X1 [Schistocerca serialis cubense]